jgi:hypothetical protein
MNTDSSAGSPRRFPANAGAGIRQTATSYAAPVDPTGAEQAVLALAVPALAVDLAAEVVEHAESMTMARVITA